MSQPHDSTSPGANFGKTVAFTLTTDGVPPSERLAFWRETALRRVEPTRIFEGDRPFTGSLRRLTGRNAEFWDHRTDAIWVTRTQKKCNSDGRGDISVALVLDCTDAMIDNGQELRLRHGDLYVMDYSQPVRATRPTHRELALMLPRQKVMDVLGDDLSLIAGRKLPLHGIGNLLRSHMRTAANEAPRLSTLEQGLAIDAAADMALAALQAMLRGTADADQVADGLYIAACATIERHCTDPQFSPDTVASLVGCSRTSLYRLFSRQGESVAAAIWSARLDRARQMLVEGVHHQLSIADVAFRCGFLDPSSFSRMFKRRFGVAPRDAREEPAPSSM